MAEGQGSNRSRSAGARTRRGAAVPPWTEPDRSRFINPFDDRTLLEYFTSLIDWHGYIRFLGLPHLGDNPDQPIQDLFVEPRLSDQHVSPDMRPDKWPETQSILERLQASPRLVLLGDPGSGKSTLVSWLAWQFARPRENAWARALGQLVPLPFVLRELPVHKGITWPKLVDQFLNHPVAKALGSAQTVKEILQRGQGLVMFDGLDEIGSVRVRESLREAVSKGVEEYPSCRWLLTSRIVGYDQVPFHRGKIYFSSDRHWPDDYAEEPVAELCYLVPFDDGQIERFAENWYTARERAKDLARAGAEDLVRRIQENEGTQRLARTPNLLTLIALVHRVYGVLPHGRATLYDKITEAYLESIDTYRGIQELPYSLKQKKRWLARVGFEMQRRRASSSGSESKTREILATEDEVQGWIASAMTGVDAGEARRVAVRFVDYVGRRSGLLLPRGEGQYAFTHLSFQEYFAACYLEEQIVSPHWLAGTRVVEGASKDDLHAYANEFVWRETLVLLFEILADRPEWVEALAAVVFGERFERLAASDVNSQAGSAELLAALSVDAHAGLTVEQRRLAWDRCWEWGLTRQQVDSGSLPREEVTYLLAGADRADQEAVWRAFDHAAERVQPSLLRLFNCVHMERVPGLHWAENLQQLWFAMCPSLVDLGALRGLRHVELLCFLDCPRIQDLSPLASLSDLETLMLFLCNGVSDLSPLSALKRLTHLHLSHCAGVADLAPLASLPQLANLFLSDCRRIVDLSALRALPSLKRLVLSGCTGVKFIPPELLEKPDLEILGPDGQALSKPEPPGPARKKARARRASSR